MKKLITIITIAMIVIFGAAANGASETTDTSLADVQAKGKFILGLDDSFPPMGYRDENNEIVGFDIDTAREVCRRLNVELVCQPIDWNAKEQELATKQIDCIWNGFTITEKRLEAMEFTAPYVNNKQVIVVRSSSSFQSPSDFGKKVIGTQAGSSGAQAIEDSADFKASLKQVVEFKDFLTALMDLEKGGVDGVVMDLIVANYSIQESGKDFRILDEGLCNEEYGIGFRKGAKSLRDAVQKQLEAMAKDGTLAAIAVKWFGADITTIGK
ncbi:MAG: amino acid ABC transporter substrate-binding protein [Sphaerochaetaceae bacterium]|jgi:polar amino acid transport system substrate-binding protein|nr:amino acid ABC transporter substrate-binding protein [Sphaerochaetaceae bacterium]NLY07055.1 amino acid ABC transporter substrate-binding protein [Spirochaetales bacterium]